MMYRDRLKNGPCTSSLPPKHLSFFLAAIRLALSQLLDTNDIELIERKTEEKYYNDLNAGDVDYAVVVLVPCLIGESVS